MNRFFVLSYYRTKFIPFKIIRGADPKGWHVIGIVSLFGSLFFRYQKCECLYISAFYEEMLKQNGETNNEKIN